MNDFPLHYWLIEKWDGEKIKIKPENAGHVQNTLASGTGFIRTKNRTINVKDVKSFDESEIPYSDQKLLEQAAQAFKKPITRTVDGEEFVLARWVKKIVPQKSWEKVYRTNPSYRLLEESDSGYTLAFVIPVHLIDTTRMTELTKEELQRYNLK